MNEAFLLLRGIALGLLLAIMLTVWLRFAQVYALRLLALFALCVCGYLLAPILLGRGPLFYLAVALSDASVLLFLLLQQALFDDHQHPDPRSLAFGAAYLLLSYVEIWMEHGLGLDTGYMRIPVRLAMFGGALYALYVVVRNWQQDLVESRRRLRLAVSAIAGAYVLGVTFVESLGGGEALPFWVEVANSAGIALSVAFFAGAALLLGAQGLLPSTTAAPPAPAGQEATATATNPEMEKILLAMEERRAYRDMELTIRSLAEQVGVAEHRLRALVNKQLDYRNFNDFLNHYRLAEVRGRLSDPAEAQVPILTIAMDAGYRSMTTFNRVFRAQFGQTPTQYRQETCPIPEKS